MRDFKKMIKVNKQFQKSINMRLDLNAEEKINSYIPTKASVTVLKEYLQQMNKKMSGRASILIGPYGKGKSHLLLVLLALLEKENQKKQMLWDVVEKIQKEDQEAAELAQNLLQKKKYYLPVLISGTQKHLGRSFLLALKEALNREGLGGIAPNTYFDEAMKTLLQWKKEYPDTYAMFLALLKKEGRQEEKFLLQLKHYEEDALKLFQKVYPSLTAGSVFEPMVQTDLIPLYQSVNEVLCEKYGYSGLIIIFDEFSKFVEGYPKESFSAAMEELQNICELANASKEQEIHVILVAHKAMKEYAQELPKSVINAYTGVEGRLREVYFTSSLRNSYQLIQNVLGKEEPDFTKEIVETKEFRQMAEDSYGINYFQNLFTEEEFFQIVAKGVYPLSPVTAYLLLKVSELAGQNERTVFTFLSNEEPYSLPAFLNQYKDGDRKYITAGWVYDYFWNVFKNETANKNIHNQWLKAEYALHGDRTLEEQEIIKTIALLMMVGKYDDMLPKDLLIRLGTGLSQETYDSAMETLREQQILLFRNKTKCYAFKNNIGVDVEKEIHGMVETKFQKINVCRELEKVSELVYELPKRYNLEYTMTRYFHYQFMNGENFLELKDSSYLFEQTFADGKILALLKSEKVSVNDIALKLQELADRRVLVIYPVEEFSVEEILKKILAIGALRQSEEFMEENKALGQELDLYEEDLLFEINVLLEQHYLPVYGRCNVIYDGRIYPTDAFLQGKVSSRFNPFLSKILEEYYGLAPKVNNELINKRVLTAQIRKARIKIMETILEKGEFSQYQKGTTPEATIFRAVFLRTGVIALGEEESYLLEPGVGKVLEEIKKFIGKAAGKRQNFSVLYDVLKGEHYGAREGILPLYLAYSISLWNEMPIIYLKEKEVSLSPQIFENINQTPENFSLYMEKETVEMEKYLSGIEKIFGIGKPAEKKENRLACICDSIYSWYCSLPQCSRTYSLDGKSTKEQQGAKTFRKVFSKTERNPREILLDKLPKAFDVKDNGELLPLLAHLKQEMDSYLSMLKENVVAVTREVFGFGATDDLLKSLKVWSMDKSKAEYVHTHQISRFLAGIDRMENHDEQIIADELSRLTLDLFIEDWKENGLEQYRENIMHIKEEVEKIGEKESREDLQKIVFTNQMGRKIERHFQMEEEDGTSLFLQNEIESALEEYGDSLETNQKISVMVRMIEKLIEG